MRTVRRRPWDERAHEAMEYLIELDEPFLPKDLRDMVGDPDEQGKPNGANSKIGSLFMQYSKAGRIEKVVPDRSASKLRKGGMVYVWRKKRVRVTRGR